jgi:hypothetical protein
MGDQILDLLLVLLPSVVVFLTAYFLLRQLLVSRSAERLAETKKDDHKHILPLRLQAYERLVLFLERIDPGGLVLRVHRGNTTARVFHDELTATVREEYEHNLAQQVYVSDKAWQRVKKAKEETIRLINIAFSQCRHEADGSELSRAVFEMKAKLSNTPSQEAIAVLKEEVRRLF